MRQFLSGLRFCDIYSSYFQLRINNEYKFRTEIGGILSLLTLGFLLYLIPTLGENFFNYLNPSCSFERGLFETIPFFGGTNNTNPTQNKYLFIKMSKDFSQYYQFMAKNYKYTNGKYAPEYYPVEYNNNTFDLFVNETGYIRQPLDIGYDVFMINLTNNKTEKKKIDTNSKLFLVKNVFLMLFSWSYDSMHIISVFCSSVEK